jgi:hypothetical protein
LEPQTRERWYWAKRHAEERRIAVLSAEAVDPLNNCQTKIASHTVKRARGSSKETLSVI